MKSKGYSDAANIVCRLSVNPELGEQLSESLKQKPQAPAMNCDKAAGILHARKYTKIQYIQYSIDVNYYAGRKIVPSYTELKDYRRDHLQLNCSESVYTEI